MYIFVIIDVYMCKNKPVLRGEWMMKEVGLFLLKTVFYALIFLILIYLYVYLGRGQGSFIYNEF